MSKVVIDIAKAVEIHKDKMREARAPLLAQLDVDFMRAVESRNVELQEKIIEKKNALRNVTQDPALDRVITTDQLKKIWPEVLNG